MDPVFQLEAFTHIPLHSTCRFIVCRSSAAVGLTGGPLSHMVCISTILVVFAAPPIVCEAVRINGFHDLHFSIGEFRDSVIDSNITETKG